MPFNLDSLLVNADWTKTAADFPDVTTRADLDALLKTQRLSLEQFKRLPVYIHSKAYWNAKLEEKAD